MPDTTLRDAMAAAIRDDLKRRTVPPIYGPCGHPISSGAIGNMGLTEFDIAETALTVVQPELDRLAAVEAAAPDWARDQTRRVMTVPVTALARKIAEKRDALAKLDEACREVDRLRGVLRGAADAVHARGVEQPDHAFDYYEDAANLLRCLVEEVPDGA